MCQKMKRRALRLALALALLLLAGNAVALAQGNALEQSPLSGLGNDLVAAAPQPSQGMPQPGAYPQMPPSTYPQPSPYPQPAPGVPSGQPSPIDGYWMAMTPQGQIMMGLQNGVFMTMGPNGQVLAQGTFSIQGQQIISTGANGQQEVLDFQCDGMNLQLRDSKTGAVLNYQRVQNQQTPQSTSPYPGYPGTLPGQPGVSPGQQSPYQPAQPQYPQQYPQPYQQQQQ